MRRTTLLVALLTICASDGRDFREEIADFLTCNASPYLSILIRPSDLSLALKLRRSLAPSNVYANVEQLPLKSDWKPSGFHVVLVSNASSSPHNLAKNTTIKSFLYIFEDEGEWHKFTAQMMEANENFLLYTLHQVDHISFWHQIITVKNQKQVVINPLKFIHGSLCIREDYDLHGLEVESVALDWVPYLMHSKNCTPFEHCPSEGALMEKMGEIARRFNFTAVTIKEEKDDWGVMPQNGSSYDCNGIWTGAFGKVVTGQYPLSLSEWAFLRERADIVDYVHLSVDYRILVLSAEVAALDASLFVRPFNRSSWIAVVVCLTLFAAFLALLRTVLPFFRGSESFRMVATTSWFLFIGLNAYYGGALTMFFVGKVSPPFEDVRQVIRGE